MQTVNVTLVDKKQPGAQEVNVFVKGGKPSVAGITQVDFVADPAGDTPTKAEYVALRDAMVASGIMKPQA